MPRSPTWSVVLLTILIAGCSTAEVSSASEAASLAWPSRSPSAGPSVSDVDREPLPSGFPVLAGALAVPLTDDDPGLIRLWESEQMGSVAYDFYVNALPTAGYSIVGLYPGGDVALIRFRAMNGQVWQVIAQTSADGGTRIEVRRDRP